MSSDEAMDQEAAALRRQIESAVEAAEEGLRTVQDAVSREVRANPIAMVTVAALVGVGIGLLIARP